MIVKSPSQFRPRRFVSKSPIVEGLITKKVPAVKLRPILWQHVKPKYRTSGVFCKRNAKEIAEML
jgi:hypothetical protein